jgi:hypothetical protein
MNFDLKAFGEKAKGLLKTAGEKAVKAATDARGRADRAAEAVAAMVTEVTGRETTAAEVKKAAAVVAGAVVLGTAAVAVAGGGGRRGLVETALGGGSGDGWGSDFESQAVKGFAELGGSLNFYTPHVDSCGTVYSGPNG